MLHKLLFFLVLLPTTNFSQTKFSSSKYNYSFVIPDGWYVKDKIYNPDVDAKIVDGKGNSFIISIKTFPTSSKKTMKQEMSTLSNSQIEEQFGAMFGETKIVKRGTIIIDQKEFYFMHLLTPFEKGLKLYHKQYAYSYGNRAITIDACSIETYLDDTRYAFALMLDTFKLLNLKNKTN